MAFTAPPGSAESQPRIPGLGHSSSLADFLRNTPIPERNPRSPPKQKQQIPGPPAQPVPVGSGRSVEDVITLYKLCQERMVTPFFEFEEIENQLFSGTLTVGGHVIEEKGPFRSKKEAKEKLAERGVELVKGIRRSSWGEEKAENWVGVLLEYATSQHKPAPVFQEFALGLQFACEASFDGRVFGDKNKPLPSKKAAKSHAAQEAVMWLREQGRLTRKPTGAAGAMKRLQEKGDQMNDAEQVNVLAPILGLPTPEYRMHQDPRAAGFWSGTAHFGKDRAAVASVMNVFGKQNAKLQLAKETLEWLRELQLRRQVSDTDA